MRYLSIRSKLIAPFLFLIILALGMLLPGTGLLVSRRIEAEADRRLGLIAHSVTLLLEDSEQEALFSAQFVANLPQTRLSNNDPAALQAILELQKATLELQELSYYAPDYQPGDLPLYYGGPAVTRRLQTNQQIIQTRNGLLQYVIQTGSPASGIAIAPQSAQIIGVAAVHSPEDITQPMGLVVAVFYVDQEFMQRIGSIVGADVAVFAENAVVAATVDAESDLGQLLQQQFATANNNPTGQNLVYGQGIQARMLAKPLILNGQLQATQVIVQPVQQLFTIQQDIQNILVGFGLVVAVISLMFALFAVISFSRPIEKMLAATRAISQGNLNQRVDVAYIFMRDEMSELADHFNQMTERLQALYAGLEERVLERTHDLEQALRQLAMARDEAMEASQAKSSFLANMSHELRTPLNAIIGYSEMLQEEAAEMAHAGMAADLQKILQAGRHLLQLINDVLDISKIEAGKMKVFLEEFDVFMMVISSVDTIQLLVEKNGNNLEIDCAEDIGLMYSDLTKVRQILFNLLSNAAKFTERGSIRLAVERETADSTDFFRFSVTDTGIGMNPEQLKGLFQVFTQGDVSTTRKYGGTGLGLALTRRFCQMLGGEISVTSELGKGTRFVVTLPVVTVENKAEENTTGHHLREGVDIPLNSTVLLIDDDPATVEFLQQPLVQNGYVVHVARNGVEGIQMAKQLRPNVITLDVILPDMDGWAVLSALKGDGETADIPVIVISILNDLNTGFALGAADYLVKPIERDRLLHLLRRYRQEGVYDVLVVEDDATTREMVRAMLEKDGWSVTTAENGRFGLEQVQRHKPSAIILDLMMPEMDGFQFVTELRTREDWRDIPVIVVTAKDITDEDRARLNGHVEKTLQKGAYSRHELLGQVSQFVWQYTQQQSGIK